LVWARGSFKAFLQFVLVEGTIEELAFRGRFAAHAKLRSKDAAGGL
jgi:hypothetical protein